MNIKIFTTGPLDVNCYIVSDETKECAIIDCGAFTENEQKSIIDYIRQEQLVPKHLLCTHAHIDHIAGNKAMSDAFGLKPEYHRLDQKLMADYQTQAEYILGMRLMYELPMGENLLNDGDVVEFGNTRLRVMLTPGHSPGGVFFVNDEERRAFCGDTIFCGSIGRTDFMGGSMFQIINSLRLISQMPDDTELYPGHGPQTTIGYELAHNPYMDR